MWARLNGRQVGGGLRRQGHRVTTDLARRVVWLLLRLLPPRRHAVVHGWPDSEANAVEVVRALRRRYRGTIYWLLDDLAYRGPAFAAQELSDTSRICRVPKGSVRGVWLCLTAELTFFTHGLYTAVRPPCNRLVVNLWHGDGPKSTRDTHLVRSSVVVSGAQLWGDYKATLFKLPTSSLAVVGNPRIDQFAEPLDAEALGALGLDPDRGRVLWMPTYRQASGPKSRSWSDGCNLSDRDGVGELLRETARAAERSGLQLLIKPHPLDVDRYADLDVLVVRDEDLNAARVSLYQLLGGCDGLISDVSSVWVDFLVLDRPIAFYIPDLEELKNGRGLNVEDLEALLPGPRLVDTVEASAFLTAVASGAPGCSPSAWPGAGRIGAVSQIGAAERLLDWLSVFQAMRAQPAMFAASGGAQSKLTGG